MWFKRIKSKKTKMIQTIYNGAVTIYIIYYWRVVMTSFLPELPCNPKLYYLPRLPGFQRLPRLPSLISFLWKHLLYLQQWFALCLWDTEVEEDVGGHGNSAKKPICGVLPHEEQQGGEHLGHCEQSCSPQTGDDSRQHLHNKYCCRISIGKVAQSLM